jgi:PIN domain nuclease of toxin-antitoxin system
MLLLDTHAFVWLASDQTQLTAAGKAAIRAAAGALCISSITGLEIALLVKRGRLELPLPPREFIERALRQHGIEEIPVDVEIALRSAALPDIHNDPFDRIIAATALNRGCPLLSKDTVLPRYPGMTLLW